MAIVAHLFDIHFSERFLTVGDAGTERMRFSQQVRDHRLHAGTGKERRRIILWDERCRRYDRMPARFVEFQIFSSDIVNVHSY